jgi:hypothetical protein
MKKTAVTSNICNLFTIKKFVNLTREKKHSSFRATTGRAKSKFSLDFVKQAKWKKNIKIFSSKTKPKYLIFVQKPGEEGFC